MDLGTFVFPDSVKEELGKNGGNGSSWEFTFQV